MWFSVKGTVVSSDDPAAIATIQSAATFSADQPIKYLFKTEGTAGQVRLKCSSSLALCLCVWLLFINVFDLC